MRWGTVEETDDDGLTVAVHIMPVDDDGTLLAWHTLSALCGCNPTKEENINRLTMYTHYEDSQEGPTDGDSS